MMLRGALLLAAIAFSFCTGLQAAQTYAARGLVLKIDKAHRSVTVSCEEIPKYMEAMVMSFRVKNSKELDGLGVGTMIEFTLVVAEKSAYVEGIRVRQYQAIEQDPLAARRLKLISGIVDSEGAPKEIETGERVPDFKLVDQNGRSVTLWQYSGKVVVLTFTYTHCVLPNFCFRNSNNFRLLQKRFSNRMGKDLILMTITFDPVHDTPDVLAIYGKTWSADSNNWKLLTGNPADISAVAERFGMSYWFDEGLMNHSLHTVIIDRNGRMAAKLEGNEYSADELGDVVLTVLEHTETHNVHHP